MSGRAPYQNISGYPFMSDGGHHPLTLIHGSSAAHPLVSQQPKIHQQLQQQQQQLGLPQSIQYHTAQMNHLPGALNIQQPPMHPQTVSQQQQQFQRLKVEDALSYLDKGKLQFSVQPHIYNDFLDIMKEFKSQSIDTPGVINRVSNLFKGHPDLIVGFNTFLPPGYKIEMNANDTISVHQPGQKVISLYSTGVGPSSSSSLRTTAQTGGSSSTSLASNYDPPHLPLRQAANVGGGRGTGIVGNALPDVSDPQRGGASSAGDANQPVEFSHAISYVNKIKSRYQGKPAVYKAFLDILHTYQKEQRDLKEGIVSGSNMLSEKEVYSKVAVLFKDQPDLLAEFGHFLPDANGSGSAFMGGYQVSLSDSGSGGGGAGADGVSHPGPRASASVGRKGSTGSYPKPSSQPVVRNVQRRRLSSINNSIAPKKMKSSDSMKEVSMAEASKFGSLGDFAFFDKVRKYLGDRSYTDFLRSLYLYNQRILGSSELLQMIQPFSAKMPELMKRMKELLRQKDDTIEVPQIPHGKERIQGEFEKEIDYASCKRLGVSYRGLPSTHVQPKCSGRTPLCWEVLNDTLVSFPSWSEDSSSVIKKTVAEEQIFRCEDERYQLDIVLDNINATMLVLEVVQSKLKAMTPEDAAKFRLDNCLGGNSEALHRKTIHRLYKEHANDVIEGLKRNPSMVVPMVLHRLHAKQQEWSEARQNNQKTWNDQNQKYYLKSLDHQGINFKQTDTKQLRSKALLLEVENAIEDPQDMQVACQDSPSPLMTFSYPKGQFFEDSAALIIHHVKRQTSIHQDEKQKIKQLLNCFLPHLFYLSRSGRADSESREDPDLAAKDSPGDRSPCYRSEVTVKTPLDTQRSRSFTKWSKASKAKVARSPGYSSAADDDYDADDDLDEHDDDDYDDDDEDKDATYNLMFGNNNWYLFLRLHHILYTRLQHFHTRAQCALKEEEKSNKEESVESTAVALGLKPPKPDKPVDCYPVFLELVRNYLDGNLETVTFEEQLREMFTIHAYLAFTMDKLIQNIIRQLQHLVGDPMCTQMTDLYKSERSRLVCLTSDTLTNQRLSAEQAYQRKAEQILTDENCFRICFYKRWRQLTLDLIDPSEHQSDGLADDAAERWRDYVEQFVGGSSDNSQSANICRLLVDNPVILMRNVRSGKRAHRGEVIDSMRGDTAELDSRGGVSCSAGEGLVSSLNDDLECKFRVNSFKMLYVESTSGIQYRRGSLTKAHKTHRALTLSKHAMLTRWTNEWLQRNVTQIQRDACSDWFMGHVDGLIKSKTTRVEMSDLSKKPYYVQNLYRCTRL